MAREPIGSTVSTSISPSWSVKPGAVITVNLERTKYFRSGPFLVSFAVPTAKIPLAISQEELQVIRSGVTRGELLLGDVEIKTETKEPAFDALIRNIEDAKSPSDIKPRLIRVASGTSRIPDPHSLSPHPLPAYEVLEKVAYHEAGHKCRQDIMHTIADVMSRTYGATGVVEVVQERKQVEVRPPKAVIEYQSMEGFEELI